MAGNADAKPGLAKARLAYIYGVGGPDPGIPVRSKSWLLEVSTVDPKTLDRHLKIWDEEMEVIAKSKTDNPFGITLREETIAAHAEDVEFLRRATDSLKNEFENIDEIQLTLYQLVESIGDNLVLTGEELDSVRKLLDSYLQHSANRKSVLNLFLATQKRWQDSSAVSSTIAAYETTLKETAKRKAKQAADEAGVDQNDMRRANAGQAAKGNTEVFRR